MKMLMERKYLLLLFILVSLSGCRKQKHTTAKQHKPETTTTQYDVKGTKVAFDEDIEAFVLEDESGVNPFSPDGKGNPIVAQNSQQLDVTWEDPKEKTTVYFDYDSAKIKSDQEQILAGDIVKRKEQAARGEKINVKGHACQYHGTKIYNIALSEHRAQEIATRYEKAGISRKQMNIIGVGNEEPIVFSTTKDGNAPNRRVEIATAA